MQCATSSSNTELVVSAVEHQDLCHDQGNFVVSCIMYRASCCCAQRHK